MSADTVTTPDIDDLANSPELQAQLALLTQQAAAQLAALVEALRAAEAALGPVPPPPPPEVPVSPVDEIPVGLPWEPPEIPALGGYDPPIFVAPAVEGLPEERVAKDLPALSLRSLAVEAPLSAVAEIAPLGPVLAAAPAVESPGLAAMADIVAASGALAGGLPDLDALIPWAGAEGSGV